MLQTKGPHTLIWFSHFFHDSDASKHHFVKIHIRRHLSDVNWPLAINISMVSHYFIQAHAGDTALFSSSGIEKVSKPIRGRDHRKKLLSKESLWIFTLSTRLPNKLNIRQDILLQYWFIVIFWAGIHFYNNTYESFVYFRIGFYSVMFYLCNNSSLRNITPPLYPIGGIFDIHQAVIREMTFISMFFLSMDTMNKDFIQNTSVSGPTWLWVVYPCFLRLE